MQQMGLTHVGPMQTGQAAVFGVVMLLWALAGILLSCGAAHGQTYVPGQRLDASCTGQWANLTTSQATISADCVEVPPPPPAPASLVIDHTSLPLFDRVPQALVNGLRVMSVDRSVGWNISQGIGVCLNTATAQAPSFCKRWAWADGSYAVPPMVWTAHPLSGWRYFGWPGSTITPELPCTDTSSKVACFVSYVDAHAAEWDVVSMQPSYLDAGSGIPVADYLAAYDALRARHPSLTILLHTASLARTVPQTAFNQAVRAHHAQHGGILVDIADIEAFDPFGVETLNANGEPIISPFYTSEASGGHLGYPSAGMIRLAQAWWIALAQAKGWVP